MYKPLHESQVRWLLRLHYLYVIPVRGADGEKRRQIQETETRHDMLKDRFNSRLGRTPPPHLPVRGNSS